MQHEEILKQYQSWIDEALKVKNEDQSKANEVLKYLKVEIPRIQSQLSKYQDQLEEQLEIIANASLIPEDEEVDSPRSNEIKRYNDILQEFERIKEDLVKLLESTYSPFFGELEVKNKGKLVKAKIGKHQLLDKDSMKNHVIDWRSPVASAFYQSSGPGQKVEIKIGENFEKVETIAKTSFEIREGLIKNVYEAKSGNRTADEFLLKTLQSQQGDKLSDIITTIQSEQDALIRRIPNRPTIIQGVAGSGKTSIALHHISFILFSDEIEIDRTRVLYVVPNNLFRDYVSDLKPMLGLEDTRIETFYEWAKSILKLSNKVIVRDYEQADFNQELLKKYNQAEAPKLIKSLTQKYIFNTLREELKDEVYLKLRNYISQYEEDKYSIPLNEKINSALIKIKKQFPDLISGKRLSYLQTFLKKEFSPIKILIGLHDSEEFENSIQFIKRSRTEDEVDMLFNDSLDNETKSELGEQDLVEISRFDLAKLLIIKYTYEGNSTDKLAYTIIDEAQDHTPLELFLFTLYTEQQRIFFIGDTAQAIKRPILTKSWDDLNAVLDLVNLETDKFNLIQSYRTTSEVINYVNDLKLADKLFGDYPPTSVERHGEAVQEIKMNSDSDDFVDMVRDLNEKDYATIGVITKSNESADVIFKLLQDKLKITVQNRESADYTLGTFVIPVEFSKGLEFDVVILVDFDNENYEINLEDTKLAYVGMTRAMHRLIITYKKQKSQIHG